MALDIDQADFLERLAAELARLDDFLTHQDRQRLEELLTGTGAARLGGIGMPTMQVGAADSARTLGNVQPYYGQTNVLEDPIFEKVETVNPIGTTENAYAAWRAKYVLNSGTAPTTRLLAQTYGRISDYNPFNSSAAELRGAGFASGSTTFYVYPNAGFVVDANTDTLPYLVASLRVADFGNTVSVLTNITSITATLQIIDGSETVQAESDALDFKALIGRRPEQFQLVTSMATATGTFKLRLKVVMVASGAGGLVSVFMGEPMLHYAFSTDPAPFSPQIARHYPSAVTYQNVNTLGDAGAFIITSYDGQNTNDLFLIRGDGELRWGGGQGGGLDLRLRRSGPKALALDDGLIGNAVALRFGGTTFPANPSIDALAYRTDLKMWFFFDGTRWLSTDVYEMTLAESATNAGAGALGATTNAIGLWATPWLRGGSDIWLENVTTMFFVAGGGSALSASHKWVGTFNKRPTGNTDTTIKTVNIDSGASAVWRTDTQNIGALMNAGTVHYVFGWNWTKTGTPGNLNWSFTVAYRVVAT